MEAIIYGVLIFTGVVTALVSVILISREFLVAKGNVKITVNGQTEIEVPAGGKLMNALGEKGILVSSACGGGGTCAQCIVKVHEGGGDILETETGHINKREAREGCRLSCQVAVKQDMIVEVPHEALETKKWECTVRSNDNVATFIKELVLELPEGEDVDFKAGVTSRSKLHLIPYSTKILTSKNSTIRTGTSSTFGGTRPKSKKKPSARIRWRTTRAKRALSCSTFASRLHLHALPKEHRRVRCRRSFST